MVPDFGKFLQERYDSGSGHVTLSRVDRWTWDTPVFLDSPRFGDKFEVNLAGAEITLGPNLPTMGAAFTPDARRAPGERVRAAIFPNTQRAAWNAATNDVAVTTGKATMQGASVRLHLRNGTISGGGRNVGIVMGNRVGTVLENVVAHGVRFALSWHDYAEPNIVRGGHFQTAGGAAQVADAFYVYEVAKGDGILIEALKCDGAVGAASLMECFGAVLSGNITGKVRLSRCAGVVIVGVHQEAGIYASYSPNFEVSNSDVLFVGGAFYPPRQDGRATVEITDDTTGVLHSTVVMQAPCYRLPSAHTTVGPFVDVRSRNPHTKVRIFDPSFKASTGPGVWVACDAPLMTGVDS